MVSKEFFEALADLEAEKGISSEVFIEALRNALVSAYKKQYEGEVGRSGHPHRSGKVQHQVLHRQDGRGRGRRPREGDLPRGRAEAEKEL